MPVKPEYKTFYNSPLWKQTRLKVLARAGNKCEFCGIENGATNERGSIVRLTVAHMDHGVYNLSLDNLRALCQACHLDYDKEQHIQSRKKTLNERKYKNQLLLKI